MNDWVRNTALGLLLGLVAVLVLWLAHSVEPKTEEPAGNRPVSALPEDRTAPKLDPPDAKAPSPPGAKPAAGASVSTDQEKSWEMDRHVLRMEDYPPTLLEHLQRKIATVEAGGWIEVEFFPGKSVIGQVDRAEHDVNGTRLVRARIGGEGPGSAVLLLAFHEESGKTRARADLPLAGSRLEIFHRASVNTHLAVEKDLTAIHAEESALNCEPIPGSLGEASAAAEDFTTSESLLNSSQLNTTTTAETRIDVLIAYTEDARGWADENGGIETSLAISMQTAQLALDNSQAGIFLRMAHSEEVDYTESRDSSTDLKRLKESIGHPDDVDGDLDEMKVRRNEVGADLVALWCRRVESGIAGRAYLLLQTTGRPDEAFSVTKIDSAVNTFTFIHELGHNMGCAHSRNQSSNAAGSGGGLYPYSTGWRWTGTDGSYTSVMTYSEGSQRSALFSSPEINWEGAPSGSYDEDDPVTGEFAPADNARSIREVRTVISNYRVAQPYVDNPVELLAPLGGEYWERGSTQTIRWRSGSVLTVLIELSLDDGQTWQVLDDSAPAGLGRYEWTIPNDLPLSSACKVRVSVSYATEFFDETPGTFSISGPLAGEWDSQVLEPDYGGGSITEVQFLNATEGFAVGRSSYLSSISGVLSLVFKTLDGGLTWSTVYSNSIGNGHFNFDAFWFFDSLNGLATVNRNFSSGMDVKIFQTTDGGVSWQEIDELGGGRFHDAHFFSTDVGIAVGAIDTFGRNPVRKGIFRTDDGGQTWLAVYLASNSYNEFLDVHFVNATHGWTVGWGGEIGRTTDGGHNWTVSKPTDYDGIFRGVDFVDTTTGWAVGEAGRILKTTDGGETWVEMDSGSTADLNQVDFVNALEGWVVGSNGTILHSRDGGETWSFQGGQVSDDLLALAMIDHLSGVAAGEATTSLNYTGYLPSITFGAPGAGDAFYPTTQTTVTWEPERIQGDLILEFSADDGGSWSPIVTGLDSFATSHLWTVPNEPTTQARLRVREDRAAGAAATSEAFTILPPVVIEQPTVDEALRGGVEKTVRWQSGFSWTQDLKLEYSPNNGSAWLTIATVDANDEDYDWQVPLIDAPDALFRMSLASDPSPSATIPVSIYVPTLAITSPDEDDSYTSGDPLTITWNADSVENLLIQWGYRGDPEDDDSWETLVSSYPAANGSYAWEAPVITSRAARVRIQDTTNTLIADYTAPFEIRPPGENLDLHWSKYLGNYGTGIAKFGDLVFAIAFDSTPFQVFDTSDPTAPVLLNADFNPPGIGLNGIALSEDGQVAFVAAGPGGFFLLDVADPASGVPQLAQPPLPGDALDAAVNGSVCFVTDDSGTLTSFNVSVPALPVQLDQINGLGNPRWVHPQGDLLFISNTQITASQPIPENSVIIIDASDPENLEEIQRIVVPGFVYDLAIHDGLLLCNQFDENEIAKIRVYDVADPLSPQLLSIFLPSNTYFPYAIDHDGERAWILCSGAEVAGVYKPGRLSVLDIREPHKGLKEIAYSQLGGDAPYGGIVVEDGMICAVNAQEGLLLFDDLSALPALLPQPFYVGPELINGRIGLETTIDLSFTSYKILDPQSWTSAAAEASTDGGILAKIDNSREQALIEDRILTAENNRQVFWIGLTDQAREGSFLWQDGAPPKYTNWKSGEPNDYGSGEDYTCINWEFARNTQTPKGTWNDTPNGGSSGFGGLTDGPYPGLAEFPVTANDVTVEVTNLPPGLLFDPATWQIQGAPTQTGLFTGSISVSNDDWSSTHSLRIDVADFTLTDWINNLPAEEQPPPDQREPGDNSDQDTFTLLEEFVYNLDANGFDSPALGPQFQVNTLADGKRYFEVTFRRRRALQSVETLVQMRQALGSDDWQVIPVIGMALDRLDEETDLVTLRLDRDLSEDPEAFVRLKFRIPE